MVVDDVRGVVQSLHTMTDQVKGFVVSSEIYEYDEDIPSANVSLRIPSEGFDASLDAIRTLGDVEREYITGRDVTEEFVDLSAQLENLAASEQQYLKIMERAGDIADVLAVQRELTSVRSQIERIEGRIKYLQESASYSLITISLSTSPSEIPVVDPYDTWKPGLILREAARSLVELGQSLLGTLIWIGVFAPVWIIVGLISWVVYRRVVRRA